MSKATKKKTGADSLMNHEAIRTVTPAVKELMIAADTVARLRGSMSVHMTGRPGIGKTAMMKMFAEAFGRTFVKVAMTAVSQPYQLFFQRQIKGGETTMQMTDLANALVKGNAFVFFDEFNRGAPGVEAPLFNVLDGSTSLTINEITLNFGPNLLFGFAFNTSNKSEGQFTVGHIDPAMTSRMGPRIPLEIPQGQHLTEILLYHMENYEKVNGGTKIPLNLGDLGALVLAIDTINAGLESVNDKVRIVPRSALEIMMMAAALPRVGAAEVPDWRKAIVVTMGHQVNENSMVSITNALSSLHILG